MERFNNGLRILDVGFQNTAVAESQITHVDGTLGKIHYRGHSIDYLMGHHDFEEVAYLLIWGHIPSLDEKLRFRRAITNNSKPSQLVFAAIQSLPSNSPAFVLITVGLSAWLASDPTFIPVHMGNNLYQGKPEAVDKAVIRSVAAMSTVVAIVYCHKRCRTFTAPDPDASFVENQLRMMGHVEPATGRPKRKIVDILNRLWILYADHEMTNSTAACLTVTSTLADPISGLVAGTVAGSGPLHAGAIDIAYEHFERIGSPRNVARLIDDVKAKKTRLFGYGHRIYKTVDPRANHLQSMLAALAQEVQGNPLLAVAMEIDRIASQDEYFTSRKLKANADLYGCFVFSALGFEPDIITAMAAVARTFGGMAHCVRQWVNRRACGGHSNYILAKSTTSLETRGAKGAPVGEEVTVIERRAKDYMRQRCCRIR